MSDYVNNDVYECPYCANGTLADGYNDQISRVCWKCAEYDTAISLDGVEHYTSIKVPKFSSITSQYGHISFEYYQVKGYYYSVTFISKNKAQYYFAIGTDIRGVRGVMRVNKIDPTYILDRMHRMVKLENFR